MINQDLESKELSKITLVATLPSPDYKPTVYLAMLHMITGNKRKSSVVIQRYDSTAPGQNPVWKPLRSVVATPAPQLTVLPGISKN